MNTTLSLILAACVLLPPQTAPCPPAPPPVKDNALIVGCIVVGMGGIIVVSLLTLCKHIEDVTSEPPPPPVTNNPITRVNWTNSFPPNWKGLYPPPGYVSPKGRYQDTGPAHVYDLVAKRTLGGIEFDASKWTPSPMSGHQPMLVTNGVFDSYFSLTLESSTDLQNWKPVCQSICYQCSSTNFFFEDGSLTGTAAVLMNTYRGRYDAISNNVPIFSGYHSQADGICMIPPDCIVLTGERPQEFFRWVQP